MSSRSSRTIYVGNLPGDTRMREVEDLFYKYGPIVDIDLKIPPRPPGYAFVEFEDYRDAEDAICGRDGYNFDGYRLRVELAHGGRRQSSSVDCYSSYSSGGSRGVSRRSDYRVLVTGLPSSASWQDLKDHMRRAGDVYFSQVFRDRGGMTGIVDYTTYDDMKYAIRKLDRSEFRNAFSRAYVRVREYDSRRSYSISRSRSPYYSRSRSRSPYYSRSRSRSPYYSRSRSRSPCYSRSRSHSPSWSYSPRSRRSGSIVFDNRKFRTSVFIDIAAVFLPGANIHVDLHLCHLLGLLLSIRPQDHLPGLFRDLAILRRLGELDVKNLMGCGAQMSS